ncbi:hypothetical protein AGMMS50262_10130 [Bacteroidia bacterium]|nr:hypothetical protein AGMMS50262_10130 [Bacteroidia bacterium]
MREGTVFFKSGTMGFYKRYKKHQSKLKIIRYLEKDTTYDTAEKEMILHFLKNNPLDVFPYDFIRKYNPENILVYSDKEKGLKYVLHEDKRLYFKRKWSEKKIKGSYSRLLMEQDPESPHRYETPDFYVQEGEVVADAGVAEGNFALSIVEKVKKLYLFEVDEEWLEALDATFAPWKEKVVIVHKYVSDKNDDKQVKLDDFFKDETIDFLKADIEGAEVQMLDGCQALLSVKHPLKIIVCAYHKPNDADILNRMLTEKGFQTEFSKGYMIFKRKQSPYLRKGLIRGRK